jgi:hypothetical protein
MADAWYESYPEQVANINNNWSLYDCYIMLLTDAYDPAGVATHVNVSDLTAWEVSGTGYDPGGKLLVDGVTGWLRDAAQKTVSLTIPANPEWPSSTIIARYAVLYTNGEDPKNDSSSILMALLDLERNVSSVASTLTIEFDPSGVVMQVNAEVGDTGYQYALHRAFQAEATPYDIGTKYASLMPNAYTPDYENEEILGDIPIGSVGSATLVGITQSLEGDSFVYRYPSSYTFTEFTGAFDKIVVYVGSEGLAPCIHLASEVDITGASDMTLTFPSGVIKITLVVEAA